MTSQQEKESDPQKVEDKQIENSAGETSSQKPKPECSKIPSELLNLLFKIIRLPCFLEKELLKAKSDDDKKFILEGIKTYISGLGLIATFFAGIAIALNFYSSVIDREINVQKFTHEKQTKAKEQDNIDQRLLIDKMSKAVEQLSSEKVFIRTSGIYSLGAIAKGHKDKHTEIKIILSSFIRPPSLERKNTETIEKKCDIVRKEHGSIPQITLDKQTAINHIGKLENSSSVETLSKRKRYSVFLDNSNFSNAIIPESDLSSIDFSLSDFHKSAFNDLTAKYSNFDGADFIRSRFVGNIDFTGASFYNARLCEMDLSEAGRVNMSSTDLTNVVASEAKFPKVNFSDAKIDSADLSNTDLSNANLSNADLSNADLSNADLSNAENLDKATILNADITGAKFFGVSRGSIEFKSACGWEKALYFKDEKQNRTFINSIEEKSPYSKRDCSWIVSKQKFRRD